MRGLTEQGVVMQIANCAASTMNERIYHSSLQLGGIGSSAGRILMVIGIRASNTSTWAAYAAEL